MAWRYKLIHIPSHVLLSGECLRRRKQQVINKNLSKDIVLDIGEDDKIVGIEILDASKHLNLEKLLPLHYEMASLRHQHG